MKRLSFIFLLGVFIFSSASLLAQPVWESTNNVPATGVTGTTPLLRRETRSIGMVVNLDRTSTVYYVIYPQASDPTLGGITNTAIKSGPLPAGKETSGSFVFGDASYCRAVYPANSVAQCQASVESVRDRVYSYMPSGLAAGTYVAYFTAESIPALGGLTTVRTSTITITAPTRSCLRVGSTTLGPIPIFSPNLANNCSPATFTLSIGYIGVDFQNAPAIPVLANVNFGDASATGTDQTLTLQNSPLGTPEMNKAFRMYTADLNKVYNYSAGANPAANPSGSGCTFQVDVEFNANVQDCGTSPGGVDNSTTVTIWDKPNTVRGLQDVQPNGLNNDDGGIDDEEFEICEGSRTPITFTDNSVFNCTTVEDARAPLPNAPNREARWVQWVYGVAPGTSTTVTTSAAPNDQVTINGVDFLISDLPVYGPITYIAASVAANPNTPSLPIRMPINAISGAVLMVEMRSWNTCLPYDNDVSDGGLNPIGGPFDVGPAAAAKWFTATGAYPGADFSNASTTPITFPKPIVVVDAPAPPTFSPDPFVLCEELASGSYLIAVSSLVPTPTYRFYNNAALTGTPEKTDATSPFNYNPTNEGASAFSKDNPGTYTRYATVQADVGGGQTCTSLPVTIPIVIEEKVDPGAIAHIGPFTICSGTDPVAFTSTAASGGRDGTPTYQWQSSNDNFVSDITTIGGATAATYNPPPLASGDDRYFRRMATSDNGGVAGVCAIGYSNIISFTIDVAVTGGTLAGNQTICAGAPDGGDPANLTSVAPFASGGNGVPASYTYEWESATALAGPYTPIGSSNSTTYNPPSGLTVTTFYRRSVTSGVCATDADSNGLPDNKAYSTNVITVTVQAVINPGSIGSDEAICSGGNPANITSGAAATGGSGLTYSWESATNATFTAGVVAPILGAALATYDPPSNLTTTTWYRRRATGGACSSQVTTPVKVTVNTLPTAAVSGGGSICGGGATPAPDVIFTLTGTGPWNVVYAKDGVSQPVLTGITSPYHIVNPAGNAVGIVYTIVSITDSNVPACTSPPPAGNITGSATVTVIATPPPSVETFTATAAVCHDGPGLATNPPDAILDLLPNSVQNYDISYTVNGVPFTQNNVASTAAGVITLTPPYTAWGSTPGSYVVRVTALKNTVTLCAGAVPFDSDPLVVNPRPPVPTGAVPAIACSTAGTGATLSVTAPPVGYTIVWSTTAAPTFTAAVGTTGGTRGNTFTPTSNATVTYQAFTRDDINPTNCLSATSLSVLHTQDVTPTTSVAGGVQANCTGTFTLAGNLPNAANFEVGTWSIPGLVYQQSFNYANNTTTSGAVNGWSRDVSAAGLFTGGTGSFSVQTNRFELNNADGTATTGAEAVWLSPVLNITSLANVSISVALSSAGTGAGDYLRAYYKLNGGAETLLTNGTQSGNFGAATATAASLNGTSLQLVIRGNNSTGTEFYRFDDILIAAAGAPTVSTNINDRATQVSGLPVAANVLTWTITSRYGVCAPSATTVTLTRNPLPTVTAPTLASRTFCEDYPVTAAHQHSGVDLVTLYNAVITGGAGSTTVTWTRETPLPVTVLGTAPPLQNVTAAHTYTALVTNTGTTCTNSILVGFVVNQLPAAANPTIPNLCSDSPGGNSKAGINLTSYNSLVHALGVDFTFSWHTDAAATAGGLISSGGSSGQDGNYTIIDSGTDPVLYVRVHQISTGCDNIGAVTFPINSQPLPNPIDGAAAICVGNSFVYSVTANPGSTYSWTIPAQYGIIVGGGGATSGGGAGPFTNQNFVYLSFGTSTAPAGLPISVIERTASCDGLPNSKNIIVSASPPAINIQSFPDPLITDFCKLSTAVFEVPTAQFNPSSTYVWSITNPIAVGTDATIIGSFSGTGLQQIIVKMGTKNTAIIDVVETNSGCPGVTVPLSINILDAPVMNAAAAVLCSGELVSSQINFSTLVTQASDFNWKVKSIAPIGSITGAFVNDTGFTTTGLINTALFNTSGANGTITYTVTPTAKAGAQCIGAPLDYAITVKPEPVVTAITNQSFCPLAFVNGAVSFPFSSNVPGATFNWTSSNPAIGLVAPSGSGAISFTAADNLTGFNIVSTINVTAIANGCTSAGPNAKTFTITIKPRPVVDVVSDVLVCPGDPISVPAFTANTGGGETYGWTVTNNAAIGLPATGNGNISALIAPANNTPIDQVGTVSVTATINGCPGPVRTFTVTVKPTPIVNAISNITVCSGGTVTVPAFGSSVGNSSVVTFDWTNDKPAIGLAAFGSGDIASFTADPNTTSSPIVATISVTGTQNSCLGPAKTFTITVNPEPVGVNTIQTAVCSGAGFTPVNPQTNNINVAGGNGVISSFAWTADYGSSPNNVTGGSGSGSIVAGGTLPSELLVNVTGGTVNVVYTLVPTAVTGNCAAIATPNFTITVPVNPAPVMTSAATQTICSGSIPTINFSSNVGSSTFAWEVMSKTGTVSGATVGNTGTGNLNQTLTNVSGSSGSVTYRVRATGPAPGLCVGAYQPVVITVEPQPVIAAGQVKSICSGSAVNYHVNLLPATLPLNTQFSWPLPTMSDGSVQGSTGTNVNESAAFTITDVLTNTTGANITATYLITPTVNGGLNCTTLPAVSVVITVQPQPIIAPGQVKTICSGSAVNYHVNLLPAGFPVNTRFSWPDPDGAGPATAGTNVNESSVNTITDILTNTTGSNLTVTYSITPTVNGGLNCTTLPPVDVVITVEPQPVIVAGQVKTICSGSAVDYHVNLLPSGLPANTRYSWPDPDGAGPATAGTNVNESAVLTITDILTNTTGSNITVTYNITPTVNGGLNCSTLPAVPVVITVEPQPVIVAGQVKTICSGSAVNYHVNLLPAGLPSNTRYSWPDPDGAGPATAGTNVNESTALTITDVLTNTTGVNLTVIYSITPTVNGGLNCTTLPPVDVVITVEPQPIIVAGQTKTICSGSAVNYHVDLLPAGLPANTRYNWPDPDGAGPATAGVNVFEASGNTITDILTNTTGSNLTVTYMITPTVSGGLNCTTLPAVAVAITVEPQPVIVAGQVKTICSGSAVNYHVDLLPATLPANTRYSWPDPDGAGPATAGVNVNESNVNTITDILTNTTGTNLTVTYMITPTVNGGLNCTTLPAVPVVITVEPQPIIIAGQTKTICSGSAVNYHVNLLPSGLPAGTRYSWPDPDGGGPATAGTNVNESAVLTITDILTNTTGANLTVTYMITPAVNGGLNCTTLPAVAVVITVEPQPVIVAGQVKTICSGSAVDYHVNLLPSGLPSNTRYSWPDPDGAGPATARSNVDESDVNTITDILTNTTGANITVTYNITPTVSGGLNCTTLPAVPVVITVEPQPVIAAGQVKSICSGSAVNYHVNLLPATLPLNTQFSWPLPTMSDGSVQGSTGTNVNESAAFTITDVLTNTTGANITATYLITPTVNGGLNCTTLPAVSVVITVQPQPIIAPGQVKTICSGSAVNYHVNLLPAGFPVNTRFSWPDPDGAGPATAGTNVNESSVNTITDILTNTTGSNLTVTYSITPTVNGGLNCTTLPPVDVVITVEPQPVIVAGQVKTICSGSAVDYHVNLLPSGLPANTRYSWPDPDGAGPATAGTNVNESAVLTITDILTNTTGSNITVTYNITPTVNGGLNCSTLPAVPVVITVEPQPVIVAGQVKTICSGSAVNYHVNLLPAGLPSNTRYSWPDPDGVAGPATAGSNVNESTALTITDVLTNTTGVNLTVTYSITPTVNGGLNCTTLPPVDVVITVEPQPIIVAGQTKTICSGSAVNYHVDLLPAGLPANTRYNWPDPDGVAGPATAGVNVFEASGNTITDILTNTTGSNLTVTYMITPTVSGGLNCTTLPAVPVVITVEPQPIIVASQVKTICSGSPVNYHVNLLPAGLPLNTRYSWPDPDGAGPATAGVNVNESSVNTITDILTNTTGTNLTVTYMITPTVNGGLNCTTLPAVPVVITVEPQPIIIAGQTKTICSGSAVNYHVNLLPAGLPAGTRYSWPDPDGVAGPATAGTNVNESAALTITDILTNTTGANLTVTYSITPTVNGGLNCTTLPPVDVVITVEPQPIIVAGQVKTICSGSAVDYHVNLLPSGLPANTRYSWPDPDGAGPATARSNVDESDVNTITDILTNTTGANITVTYNITPTVSGGLNCTTLPAVPVVITVEPQPVIAAGQVKSICSGSAVNYHVNLLPATLPLNTQFSWPLPTMSDGSVQGTIGTNVNESAGFTITDVLTNTTGANITAMYLITPTVNGGLNCTTLPAVAVVITVQPQPIIAPGQVKTICSGSAVNYHVNLLPAGFPVNTRFSWPDPDGPAGPATAGTNVNESNVNTITDILTNTTGSNLTVTYSITPTVNGGLNCTTLPPVDVVITVNPEPTAPSVTTIDRCSGDPVNFDPQTLINNIPTPVVSTFKYTVAVEAGPAASEVNAFGLDDPTPDQDPINDAFTHLAVASTADAVIVYTITPYSLADNCEGDPFTLRVVIHSQPRGNTFSESLCTDPTPNPIAGSSLAHNLATQITNGVTSKFTYVFIPDPLNPTVVPTTPPPYDRVVASTASITDNFLNNTGSAATVMYVVTPISIANNCPGLTFTYSVTIDTNPIGIPVIRPSECSSVPFSFDPQLQTAVASTFVWTKTYDPGIVVKTAGTGSGVISETLQNTTSGNTILNAVYHVTPTAGGCVGLPFDITIPIKPEPVVASTLDVTRCSGDVYGINLSTVTGPSASVGAATYDITATVHPDLIGIATTGTGLLAGAINGNSFINKKSTPLTVVYKVIPHASVADGGCAGEEKTITFTINPEPVIQPQAMVTVCSTNPNFPNGITNIVLGTDGISVNADSYRISVAKEYKVGAGAYSTAVPAGFTDAGNAAVGAPGTFNLIKNDKYRNISPNAITVRYTIVAKGPVTGIGQCDSDPQTFEVMINPEPVLDPTLVAAICSGDKIDPSNTIFELKSEAGRVASSTFIIRSVSFPDMTAGASNAPLNVAVSKDALDSDTFINTNATFKTATYVIAPISADNCMGEDETVVVTVNPAPSLDANLSTIVCSGAITNITLADNSPVSIAAATYKIMSVTSTGLVADPGNAVPNPVTGTANVNYIKNDKFVNNTNDRIDVIYQIIPVSATLCEGPPVAVKVTVEPQIISASTIVDNDICSGDAVSIDFVTPSYSNGAPTNPSVTFSYRLVTPVPAGISGYTSGNNLSMGAGPEITDVLVNTSSTNLPITVQYQITPRAAGAAGGVGCPGAAQLISVTVQPRPKINNITTKVVCEGDPVNLTLVSPTSPGVGVVKFHITAVPENASVGGFTNDAAGIFHPNNFLLTDALTNSDVEPRYVDYTFEPVNVDNITDAVICANGTPLTVRVTVNPRPVVTATPQTPLTICSSESIEVRLETDTDPSSSIVRWTALASSVDVVGESSGAGETLFQTLLNKSAVVQTVDYTITPSFSGCNGAPIHIIVTVNPTPVLTVPSKITVCAGTPFVLNLLPLVTTDPTLTTFRWSVTDVNGIGTSGEFDGTGTAINQAFINNTDASATMLYEITPIGPGGCEGTPKIINVSVAPTITAAFVSVDEGVCEGTPVFLTFELHGQPPFDFVYNEITSTGTTVKSMTKSGNIKVQKVTPVVTTTYEIVSAKDALGCSVTFTPKPAVTITVFKAVTANWTANVPPFIGGNATVTFTNTSTVLDASQFRYEWSFGTDSSPSPLGSTNMGPTIAVNYDRPGDHYITLRVVNLAAEAAGQECESTFMAKITINVLPLVADFKYTPEAACFPQNITVTENTATGNVMSWKVFDSNGRVAATSSAPLPVFLITTPGEYTIILQTSDSFTGQTAFSPTKKFTVYANPVASFQARPTTLFVPDTELITANFSTGATDYEWEFGDGETSDERTPTHFYKIEGIYDIMMIAKNDHGGGVVCKDTIVQKVTAKQGGVTKVPNAFTPSSLGPNGGHVPNGSTDMNNDVFLPFVKGVEEFNMQIYDRWGNMIFESTDSNTGWDGYDKNGKILQSGVYVFKLTLRLSDGQRTTQMGDITLIR